MIELSELRVTLEQLADEKRIAFANKTYPTAMHVIGVTNPNIKMVLKELRAQIKGYEPPEKLNLVKQLVDQNVFEMQQLAFEVFLAEKKINQSLTQTFIERIEKNLDNWVSVDYFGAIVGVAWREQPILIDKVKAYLNSDDFWKRRVAVVATVSLNLKARGGTGDTPRTLEICRMVVDDHTDMIAKALSWALRILSGADREAVIEFLEMHENRLHKRVLREVWHKLDTGLKN